MTNRKSRVHFRLTPRSMALDACYTFEFSRKFAGYRRLERTTTKRMKTDPYCQRQNCSPSNVSFSAMHNYVDIAGHSSFTNRMQWAKMAIFNLYTRKCLADGKYNTGVMNINHQ